MYCCYRLFVVVVVVVVGVFTMRTGWGNAF